MRKYLVNIMILGLNILIWEYSQSYTPRQGGGGDSQSELP